jgi:hypothetical protein
VRSRGELVARLRPEGTTASVTDPARGTGQPGLTTR